MQEIQERQRSTQIVCPSGLSGTIRRLRIRELDILASNKQQKKGTSITSLMTSVWSDTTDLGVYQAPFCEFRKDSNDQPIIDWNRVLLGDRTFVLLQLRRLSLGKDFYFKTPCRVASCRRQIAWNVDLDDIKVTVPSDEALGQLAKGENEFYRTLPFDETKVAFRLLNGADESSVAKRPIDEDKQLSSSILLRLTHVEGSSQSPKARRTFVEDMDADDAEWLQEQWEEADVHIETRIEIECDHCHTIRRIELPFDADFFSKRSALKPTH